MNTIKKLCYSVFMLSLCHSAAAITANAINPYRLDDNTLHFSFVPYLWAAQIDGTAQVKDISEHVHLSFADILKDWNFGAQGHAEARYNRWSLMIDPTYLKITDRFNVASSIPTRVTTATTLIDGGMFYRIYDGLNLIAPDSLTTLELLGGGRYLNQSTTIDIDSLPSVSDEIDTLGPIIGMRLKHYFTAKAQFWLRGDVGGFNVDHMKNTWSATAGFGYTIHKHIDVGIAYRILKIDYVDTGKNFTMDTLMYGPMVGVSFYN